MKAVVAAFNQEKALVGAFSVITNLRMELFQALENTQVRHPVVAAPHHPVTAQFWEAVWSAGEIVAIVTPGAADWPAPGPVTRRDVSRVTCDVSIRWPPLPGAAPRNLSECGDQWWPG